MSYKFKIAAAALALVVGITSIAYAKDRNVTVPNQQQISTQVLNVSEHSKPQAEVQVSDTIKNQVNTQTEKQTPGQQSSDQQTSKRQSLDQQTSKQQSTDKTLNKMYQIMEKYGYNDMINAMKSSNYSAMSEFMNKLSDADYQKMIELMKEYGYGNMADMMESIGKDNMIKMHNSMTGKAGCNGSYQNYGGMMGGNF